MILVVLEMRILSLCAKPQLHSPRLVCSPESRYGRWTHGDPGEAEPDSRLISAADLTRLPDEAQGWQRRSAMISWAVYQVIEEYPGETYASQMDRWKVVRLTASAASH